MREPRGKYSRGYLPHIDAGAVSQFITFRLADSLPATLYERWKTDLQFETDEIRIRELYRKTEAYLDSHQGECLLRDSRAYQPIIDQLQLMNGSMFQLRAFVVMPNHVHVLLLPQDQLSIAQVVKRIKGPTAVEINRKLGRHGRLWQPDYYDRVIRSEDHADKVAKYIEWNPVKAKLVADPKDWAASSATEVSKKWLKGNFA